MDSINLAVNDLLDGRARSYLCIFASWSGSSTRLEAVMASPDYLVLIEPLPLNEGGGYLATVPDLPGCMSDGATRELAARNVDNAILDRIEEAQALGRPVPKSSRHSVAVLG